MANNFLGRLLYGVGVDQSDLDKGLASTEAKVEAAMRRMDAEEAVLELKADDKDLTAKLKEAQAKKAELEKDSATLKLQIGDYAFNRQYEKIIAKVDYLKTQKANISVRIDEKGKLTQDAKRVEKELAGVDNIVGSLGRKIGSARANIGPFTLTLKALVPVLTVLSPLLTNLVGGIVAVAGSLAQAASGGIALASAAFAGLALNAGAVALAVKPVITDFKTAATAATALRTAQLKYGKSSAEAQKAQEQFNHTLAGMPPHARQAATAWARLKAEFMKRTTGIRTDFFSGISDALKTAQSLLPDFARQASSTFHIALKGFNDWMQGMRSAEAHNILNDLMGNFRKALPDILTGLGDFATGIARIAAEASNFLPSFMRGFKQVGEEFANATDNSKKLHDTIKGLMDQLHSWNGLIGATGKLLTTVLVGGAKAGQSAVQDLTDTFNQWNQQLSTGEGQRNLQSFFSQAVSMSEQFIGSLRRLITFFYAVSRATAPLATGVLDVVNALGDLSAFAVKIRPLRAILAGIGAGLATFFIAGKVAAFLKVLWGIPAAIKAIGVSATIAEAEINPILGAISALAGAATALFVGFGGDGKQAVSGFTKSQRQLKRETDAVTASIRAEHDAMANLHNAHLDLQQANIDLKNDEISRRKALDHLNNVQDKFGKGSKQARQAQLEYEQTVVNVKRDEQARSAALKDVHKNQQKETNATLNGTIALSKHEQKLTDQRDALIKSIAVAQHRIQVIHHERQVTGDMTLGEVQLRDAYDKVNNRQGKLDTVTQQLTQSQGSQKGQLQQLLGYTKKQADAASDLTRKEAQQGQGSIHLRDQMRNLGKTLGGVSGTSHGLGDMVGNVTNQVLKSFGAKQLSFNLPKIASIIGGLFQEGGTVGLQKRAGGGFIVPGSGSGDSYRTALPPGSFIMNRNAVAAMSQGFQAGGMPVALEPGELALAPGTAKSIGYGALNAMNSAVPRFASGGAVQGDFSNMKPPIVALAKYILGRFGGYQSAGYATSGHATNSYHYQGMASDIVPNDWSGASRYVNSIGSGLLEGIYNPGTHGGSSVSWKDGQHVSPSFYSSVWAEHLTHIHVAVGDAIKGMKAVAAQLKRIAIKGPAGPLRDILQAQADHLRKVANAYIAKHSPMGDTLGAGAAGFNGQVIRGKVSWFTGGATAGGGNASSDPGIAVNLNPGSDSGWNNPTTQGWMRMAQAGNPQLADVDIQGHEAVLPIIDLGPAGFTDRAIDVTGPGVDKMGFSRGAFPTDAMGTATLQGGKKKARGGLIRGMQTGGILGSNVHGGAGPGGPGSHGGHPGHHGGGHNFNPTQKLRLPPQPHGSPRHDYGTGATSWYQWYSDAIDFYDQRGDMRNDDGLWPKAKSDWKNALGDVVLEEKQVNRIIGHGKKKMHGIRKEDLPKDIRKTKPPKNFKFPKKEPPKTFHFRKKQQGEGDGHYKNARAQAHDRWSQDRKLWTMGRKKARAQWHDQKKAYKKKVDAWEKANKGKRTAIQEQLNPLYHELRIDLPTRYHDIQDKITGQAEAIGLQQTASGQERYQALLDFGGNFAALGFGVGGVGSRFGGSYGGTFPGMTGSTIGGATAGGGGVTAGIGGLHVGPTTPGRPPRSGPTPPGALGLGVPGIGGPAGGVPPAARRAAGTTNITNKNVQVHNHFQHGPPDTHTWSSGINWELGALA